MLEFSFVINSESEYYKFVSMIKRDPEKNTNLIIDIDELNPKII